jgi:heme/copper-type cytochrome/quinol oxidase subunit 3
MSDIARKDLFVCLGIWLALEIVGFALLPAIHLTHANSKTEGWFLISLPLGIGGACLIAGSTQLMLVAKDQMRTGSKLALRILSSLIGWMGLLCLGFPLLVASIQIFEKLFFLIKA